MSHVNARWRASERAIHTRTPSGGVVLDPVTKAYYALNQSGEILWVALERGATEDELVAALRREFDVDDATARDDATRWIGELESIRLIERESATR